MGCDKVTGEFKGYAYMLLTNDQIAGSLLQKKTLDFMGVKVGVLRWKASCDYINDKDSNLKRKVFIKGLEESVNDSDLHAYFSKFGTVEFAEVRRDHLTKQSRCIGFILFEKESSSTSCLAKKSHYLKNRRIYCKACKSKRDKEQKHEDFLNKISENSTDCLNKTPSHSPSLLSKDETPTLGTTIMNNTVFATQLHPSLEVISRAISSPQESPIVLDTQLVIRHDALQDKLLGEDSLAFPPLGYCANRSDNSVSTKASIEGNSTPKAHNSKAHLGRLLFSEPFIPSSVPDNGQRNKPIKIEYFTLPGNF